MSFFRTLCQDTFDKCFSFTKDPHDNPDYSKVEMSNANGEEILEEDDHKGDDKEYFNDWPTQASIYSTPGMGNEKPQEMPPPAPKKNALIGNYDEDAVYKKKEEKKPVQEDTYDDLFGDVAKPTFDQKLTSFGKNNAKQGTKPSAGNKSNSNPPKQAIEKFKMDDEVKAEEGWGDEDYEIKL